MAAPLAAAICGMSATHGLELAHCMRRMAGAAIAHGTLATIYRGQDAGTAGAEQ
jgi:hypothetical protein